MIGQKLSNRYELRHVLGRGGMAVVYLARDPWLDRDVAIKILSTDRLGEMVVERFQREAKLAAGLDHPAIVPIFDFGRHDNVLFFVMPVLRGKTLFEHLRQGTLERHQMLELAAQVAEALAYSAAHDVVHRDIKPSNLMIGSQRLGAAETPDRVWVMDFGLALGSTGRRITRSGNLPGTLAYLSPEQILSDEVKATTDIYALGTLLYEYLAGGRPFSGPPAAMLYRIVHQAPNPLVEQGVDRELADWVHRCLEKDPQLRPAGEVLAAELRALAASEPAAERTPRHIGSGDGGARGGDKFVGRQHELAQLENALQASVKDGCQLWLLGADVGLGKSRLLQELEKVAMRRGHRVLRGRFSDQERSFPYQGFCELIEDFIRQVGSEGGGVAPPENDLADVATELLAYFPSLRDLPTLASQAGAPPTADEELSLVEELAKDEVGDGRMAIFECMARTLHRMASTAPLLLVLEGLHVTDVSIEMLRYVVRRLSSAPLMFAASFRSGTLERRHPLSQLLRIATEDPRYGFLQLQPLDRQEHDRLAAAMLPGGSLSQDLASRLYETSEGNPLFLKQLLRSLHDLEQVAIDPAGEWNLAGDRWLAAAQLPETIQQLVESRLERLPEDDREILAIASVLGRSFNFDDLVLLVGDAERADAAVEHLLQGGLLEEDLRSRGDILRFTSGVTREVLYGRLARRRRRRLHRAYGEALEAQSHSKPSYLVLLHHFSEADVAAKAVHYALIQARQSLHAGSWEDVVRVTELGLGFLEDDSADDDLVDSRQAEGELRWLQAVALKASGRLEGALRQAERALSQYQRYRPPSEAAEPALLAAEIAWQLRRVDDAQRWVACGLAALADGGDVGGGDVDGGDVAGGDVEVQRKLLVLGATVANLRGEYRAAEALMDQVKGLVDPIDRAPEHRGGTLVTALPNPVTTLDPGLLSTVEDIEVMANIYETLLRPDFDGHLLPALARHWQGEDDDRIFRFFLDPAACFSDGTPVTAAAVKSSLESLAGRNAMGCSRTAYAAIEGIDDLLRGLRDELDGIEVVAEHEVVFRLSQPLPIFPVLLSGLGAAIVRRLEDGTLLGTGPFRLLDQRPGAIRLQKNPRFAGEGPWLDGLTFRTDLSAAAIAQGLKLGDLDIARDLRPEDLESLMRDSRFRSGLVEANLRNVYLIMWNANGPLASHGKLRRALGRVLRLEEMIWRSSGRFARPASSLVPPGILGHVEERPEILSTEAAKALLEEIPGPRPLRLTGAVHPILRHRYDGLLNDLRDTWQELGVEVEILEGSVAEFLARWRDPGDLDFVIGRWLPEYDDPDGFTHLLLNSEVGFLARFLDHTKLDAPLLEARRLRRPAERQALYRAVEGMLRRHDTLLPLFHDVDYRIASPRIDGLRLLRHPPYVDYQHLSRRPQRSSGLGEEASGVMLRIPLPTPLHSLDPCLATFAEVAEVVPNIFETLTRVGVGAEVVPHLAESVESLDQGRRFRVRLPDNVRFHDGRRMTSADVRYSLERLLQSPNLIAKNALVPLRGAQAFRAGECDHVDGLRVISESELIFELDVPLVFFPALLALPTTGIVPEGLEIFDRPWQDGCVGTGPFRVHHFEPDQQLQLRAFPGYRRSGFPKCDGLSFELQSPSDEIFAQFKAGTLALASHLQPNDVRRLRQDRKLAASYHELPGVSTYFLAAETRQGPLRRPEIRHALMDSLSIDRAVEETLGGLGGRAYGILPPGLVGPQGRDKSTTQPAAVEKLMGLTLRVALNSAFSHQYAEFWRILATDLERLGVHIELVVRETRDIRRVVSEGRVDLVATRWLGDYLDPDCFVSLFHSQQGVYGSLCGLPELDERIEFGRGEADPAVRHQIYRDIDRKLVAEASVMPLFHEQTYRLVRRDVAGLKLSLGVPEVAYEELRLER